MGLAHSPRIVTDNLVLYLDAANTKSYGGSGTTWSDLSGNGTDGTISGATHTSGTDGYFDFDGTDDYVETTSGWTNFGTDPFTIEVWYRPHTYSQYETLVGSKGSGDGTWQLDFNGSGNIRFQRTISSTFVDSSISFEANIWKQVVVVREGTGTNQFKIYSNGDLNTTSTFNVDLNATNQLRIGRNRGAAYYYDGNISVVRIYKNKALSASEVKQNFNALKGRYGI